MLLFLFIFWFVTGIGKNNPGGILFGFHGSKSQGQGHSHHQSGNDASALAKRDGQMGARCPTDTHSPIGRCTHVTAEPISQHHGATQNYHPALARCLRMAENFEAESTVRDHWWVGPRLTRPFIFLRNSIRLCDNFWERETKWRNMDESSMELRRHWRGAKNPKSNRRCHFGVQGM